MEYFTADWHLAHQNILGYCDRPFKSVNEMDAVIMTNCISCLRPGDVLNILGDFAWNKSIAERALEAIKKTGAKVKFVWGGHDRRIKKVVEKYCFETYDLKTITVEKQPIVLCHYALRVWDRSHYGSWHLHGHSHGNLLPEGTFRLDVGVDSRGFGLWSFDLVKEFMERRKI